MRRTRNKLIKALVVAIFSIAGGIAANATRPDLGPSEGIVIATTDGDTLVVKINNKTERVRLIGIDTPESFDNQKAYRDAARSHQDLKVITNAGKQASNYTNQLVKNGDKVRLEFDQEKRDRYGRLLAYVYLEHGRMLNEKIISDGYASPMTVPPNVKFADVFQREFAQARKAGRGLWKK